MSTERIKDIVDDMRFHIKDLECNYHNADLLKPYLAKLESLLPVNDECECENLGSECPVCEVEL